MRFGTWNEGVVWGRSGKNAGKTKKYKIDLLAVQNTHTKETKTTKLRDCVLFTSREKNKNIRSRLSGKQETEK